MVSFERVAKAVLDFLLKAAVREILFTFIKLSNANIKMILKLLLKIIRNKKCLQIKNLLEPVAYI